MYKQSLLKAYNQAVTDLFMSEFKDKMYKQLRSTHLIQKAATLQRMLIKENRK